MFYIFNYFFKTVMAASFPYSTSAYRCPSPTYQTRVESMYQAAPMVYSNMPVAHPGMMYPMTLPGYSTPGLIQRPPSPVKQPIMPSVMRTRPNTPVHTPIHTPVPTRVPTPVPSISPTREWLLDTLKRYIFTHRGILIGDYPKYEIRKKDITDKFHKRIGEVYPSDKYHITKDWISSAMANPEFLPEYSERLELFPIENEFRVAIKQADFYILAKDIAGNMEQYFNIQIESNLVLDTGASANAIASLGKIILHFCNAFIPEVQKIVFFIDQTYSTTTCGIGIPQTEMKYQHDYLTYDGNVYSVLDAYTNYMQDLQEADSSDKSKSRDYRDTNVDNSISLFEIVNNIRNGVVVFMSYVEIEECVEIILAARNKFMSCGKQEKKEQHVMVFDKFISPRVKLDYHIKIWKGSGDSDDAGEADKEPCARCNVVIDADELVCTTKCCRRTMHTSCLLELYCHESTPHSEFRCDKCRLKRKDKFGRNTEMLMAHCI